MRPIQLLLLLLLLLLFGLTLTSDVLQPETGQQQQQEDEEQQDEELSADSSGSQSSAAGTTSGDRHTATGGPLRLTGTGHWLSGVDHNCSLYRVTDNSSDGGAQQLHSCPPAHLFDTVSLQCLPEEQAICTGKVALNTTIVRKCCPLGQLMHPSFQCVKANTSLQWPPTIYRMTRGSVDPETVTTGPGDVITHVVPLSGANCSRHLAVDTDAAGGYRLHVLQNGSLYVMQQHDLYSPAAFCVDLLMEPSDRTETGSDSAPSGPVKAHLAAQYCDEAREPLKQRADDGSVMLPICVPMSLALDLDDNDIGDVNSGWFPPLVANVNRTLINFANMHRHFDLREHWPNSCDEVYILQDWAKPFMIDEVGNAVFTESGNRLPPDEYCLMRKVIGRILDPSLPIALNTTLYKSVLYVCNESIGSTHHHHQQQQQQQQGTVKEEEEATTSNTIHKCCPPNYSLWFGNSVAHCVATQNDWFRTTIARSERVKVARTLPQSYGGLQGLVFTTNANESLYVDTFGRLHVFMEDTCENRTHSVSCLDYLINENRVIGVFAYRAQPVTKAWYYQLFWIVDSCFLIVTFTLYLVLPDPTQISLNRHRRLSQTILGRLLLSYLAAMIVLHVLNSIESLQGETRACFIIGVVNYFAWLSSFAWLAVLSFEIYWGTKQTKRVSHGNRFLLYSLLGWLGPGLLTAAALAIDLSPAVKCRLYQPQFGRHTCSVSGKTRRRLYITLPVGLMVVLSTVFWLATVSNIRRAARISARAVSKQTDHQQRDRQKLYAKLCFIMGVPWLLDLITGMTENSQLTTVLDIIVFSQAIMIFIVFILRRCLLVYMWNRVCSLAGYGRRPQESSTQDAVAVAHSGVHEIGSRRRHELERHASDLSTATTTMAADLGSPESATKQQ